MLIFTPFTNQSFYHDTGPRRRPHTDRPNNPFTRGLLRSLAGTVRAQPDETEAEYAERYAAAAAAWAAFHPRDPVEQMLAAQIVGANCAAIDCLNRAMETKGQAQADRLRSSFATMNRSMRDTLRVLTLRQQRPAAPAPAMPAIEPILPRRRPAGRIRRNTPCTVTRWPTRWRPASSKKMRWDDRYVVRLP